MSEWIVIYASSNANNVEVLKAILLENNIESVIINKMDSMHIHLTNGEIELHINSKDVINAKHLISKHNF